MALYRLTPELEVEGLQDAGPSNARQASSAGVETIEDAIARWQGRDPGIFDVSVAVIHQDRIKCLGYFYSEDGFRYRTLLIPTTHITGAPWVVVRDSRVMHEQLEAAGAMRFTTTGVCDPFLAKWHRAIGYTQEGVHPLAGADGSTLVTWGRTHES